MFIIILICQYLDILVKIEVMAKLQIFWKILILIPRTFLRNINSKILNNLHETIDQNGFHLKEMFMIMEKENQALFYVELDLEQEL